MKSQQLTFKNQLPKAQHSEGSTWFSYAMSRALSQYRPEFDAAMSDNKEHPEKLVNVLVKIVARTYDIGQNKGAKYISQRMTG